MIYKALTLDYYLNARPATPEEEEELRVMKIKIEEKHIQNMKVLVMHIRNI